MTRRFAKFGRGVVVVLLCGFGVICGVAETRYVSPEGMHEPPFTSWASAGTSIQSVVDMSGDGDVILVTNGVYALTNAIVVTQGIELRGVNGRDVTVLDGQDTTRCVELGHAEAVLSGVTIRRGRSFEWGGGIRIEHGGAVRDCRIEGNLSYTAGGGIACWSGRVERCVVADNEAGSELGGGGILCFAGAQIEDSTIVSNLSRTVGGGIVCRDGGVVLRCRILDNRADQSGGGVFAFNQGSDLDVGRFHGCLIAGNSAYTGGGVYFQEHGTLENCTIVENSVFGIGGGVRANRSCWIINCVIYHNTLAPGSTGNTFNHSIVMFGDIRNSCSMPMLPFSTNSFTNAPLFAHRPAGDYSLADTSPCIDTGMDLAPFHLRETDIWGKPRPLDGDGDGTSDWDIGAMEFLHLSADSDGDGQSDADEWEAGTDLISAQSLFAVTGLRQSGEVAELSWLSVPGRTYVVESRSGQSWEWDPAPGGVGYTGSGALLTHTNNLTGGARQWRVTVQRTKP